MSFDVSAFSASIASINSITEQNNTSQVYRFEQYVLTIKKIYSAHFFLFRFVIKK